MRSLVAILVMVVRMPCSMMVIGFVSFVVAHVKTLITVMISSGGPIGHNMITDERRF
jgi:hypothetical protein